MITINQYNKYIENFFMQHLQINTVKSGNEFDFNADSEIVYPVAHIEYLNQSVKSDKVTHQFQISIGDIFDPNLPESEIEIFSDCSLIADDLLTYFSNLGSDLFEVNENVSIQKFNNGNVDRIAGATFVLSFTQFREANACIVPIENPFTGLTYPNYPFTPNNPGVDFSDYYTKIESDELFLTGITSTDVTDALGYTPISGYTVDFSNYYTKAQADSKYLSTGFTVDFSNYYTKSQSDGRYLGTGFTVDLSNYYTKSQSDSKYLGTGFTVDLSGYQPIGNYVSASTLSGYLALSGGTLSGNLLGSIAQFSDTITSNRFVKSGGTSSQFLKADGSIDSNNYLTTTSILTGQYGGTGVNNSGKTITLAGNFVTSGGSSITLTATAAANVSLPTSGKLFSDLSNSITSFQIWSAVNDGSGSGQMIFKTSPTINTPTINTATIIGGVITATTLTLGTGNTVSSSSTSTVTNKIKMVANGVTYYLLASTSAT